MGPVSGETYVGGIAGRGCDIFYSYAYPEIDCSGERATHLSYRASSTWFPVTKSQSKSGHVP